MIKIYLNQKGNIALFVLGMLSIMMILFILVINLGSALATKEKSETTATQASLAASSAIYERVQGIIDDFARSLEDQEPVEPTPPNSDDENYDAAMAQYLIKYAEYEEELLIYEFFTEEFYSLVSNQINSFDSDNDYNGWSPNEKSLEALDKVIYATLDGSGIVSDTLSGLLVGNVEDAAIHAAKATITNEKNGGFLERAELEINNNQVYIRTANEIKSTSYNGFLKNVEDKVYQESAGPVIDFLNFIWNESNLIELDANAWP